MVVTDSSVEEAQDERHADRFYLAAEIISSNERVDIDRKRSIYKLHEACTCILTVQQDRFEVRIDPRTDTSWSERCSGKRTMSSPLPRSACAAGTPLVPRQRRSR